MKDIAVFGLTAIIVFVIANTFLQPTSNVNESSAGRCLGNKNTILCIGKFDNLNKDDIVNSDNQYENNVKMLNQAIGNGQAIMELYKIIEITNTNEIKQVEAQTNNIDNDRNLKQNQQQKFVENQPANINDKMNIQRTAQPETIEVLYNKENAELQINNNIGDVQPQSTPIQHQTKTQQQTVNLLENRINVEEELNKQDEQNTNEQLSNGFGNYNIDSFDSMGVGQNTISQMEKVKQQDNRNSKEEYQNLQKAVAMNMKENQSEYNNNDTTILLNDSVITNIIEQSIIPGKMQIQKQEFDMHDIVNEEVNIQTGNIHPEAETAGKQVQVEVPPPVSTQTQRPEYELQTPHPEAETAGKQVQVEVPPPVSIPTQQLEIDDNTQQLVSEHPKIVQQLQPVQSDKLIASTVDQTHHALNNQKQNQLKNVNPSAGNRIEDIQDFNRQKIDHLVQIKHPDMITEPISNLHTDQYTSAEQIKQLESIPQLNHIQNKHETIIQPLPMKQQQSITLPEGQNNQITTSTLQVS